MGGFEQAAAAADTGLPMAYDGDSSDIEVDDLRCDDIADKDVSDEEIEPEELERRMWKDRIKLKRLKERQKLAAQQAAEKQKPKQTSDQARRKKMSRAQDGILKYMLKLMEVCKARGFVYGIIPEKGKPVSGASDNIRAWWKEKVKFDKNGPAAIANDNGMSGVTEIPPGRGEKQVTANSDSNYDVDGADDGLGSVSSRDERRSQSMDVEPSGSQQNNTSQPGQDKEKPDKPPKRKRPRLRSKPTDELPQPSQNEVMPIEPINNIPDINYTEEVHLIGYQNDQNQQEDETVTGLRSLDKDIDVESQLPVSDFNSLYALPNNEVSTQSRHEGSVAAMHFHGIPNTGMHHSDTYNFYNPSVDYEPKHERQRAPIAMNESYVRPADGVHLPTVHRNSSEISGGDLPYYVNNEQDRPVDTHFGSPLDSLSLDFGGFNSPLNFGIDGTSVLDDLLLDDDLIQIVKYRLVVDWGSNLEVISRLSMWDYGHIISYHHQIKVCKGTNLISQNS
ncbi:hypothetical protein G4B88_020930 [Cannabis sativa]|uniref:Ethylene insensitive 3-like DNA-binding domain-containing protein n=1 Tax=Cannabis sativa TaxID=3483 RepID=A0A7J6FEN0_CANSA|nr:hypothetical protein G4B88_020930 [Cannabis sativa]